MSTYEENVSFCRDRLNDEEMLRFQTMKGGHKFIIDNLYRFKSFMAFSLGNPKAKSKTSLPLLINSMIRIIFDLITPRGYLVWLVWHHIGFASWKYSTLDKMITTTDVDDAPIPPHIATSIVARYGSYEYCRYFEYSGEHLYKVYWVVLESDGKIVVVESANGWVGRWNYFMDVNWS